MAGAFFDCYEFVAVAKNSKKRKRKRKNRRGEKGNEEDGKSPSDGISDAAGMMIRSVHLGRQCN